jgi:Tfp pilus assembly protein PilF
MELRVLWPALLLAASAAGGARGEEAVDVDAELRATLRRAADAGEYSAVLRDADVALGARPSSVAALEYRAFALQRMGAAEAARVAYRALLAARPDHAWAMAQLGHLLGVAGEFLEAETMLRQSIALDPKSHDARRKLVAVQRGRRDYAGAERTVLDALAAGDDVAWGEAQIAYLAWARHDVAAAHRALGRATAASAPTDDMDRVERLLRWEAEVRADGASAGDGPWRIECGGVAVVTGLGPRLPAEIATLLTTLPERDRELVAPRSSAAAIVVHLHRTLEDHEDARRSLFPEGSLGRAFLVDRQRGRAVGAIEIHVPCTADSPATSLSHELAHAAVHDASPWTPIWLDEGLATYLEIPPAGGEARAARPDLEALVRSSLAAGRALAWRQLLVAGRAEFEGPMGRARYAQAWSVTRFLVERGGVDAAARKRRVAALLSLNPWRRDDPIAGLGAALGADAAALERAWNAAAAR